MRVVSTEEMQEIDRIAIEEFKIPSIVLMENAGARAAEIIAEDYDQLGYESNIMIFAGKGKNGGDALVVARHLRSMGHGIRLFLLHDFDAYSEESSVNLKILLNEKVRPVILENIGMLKEFVKSGPGPYLAVDGLLGTGFKGPLAGLYADVVDWINDHVDTCIALDIPTGVDGTSGAVIGQALQADRTISFGFPKLGHYIMPGAQKRGDLDVVDISLPLKFRSEGGVNLISESSVAPLLKKRDRYGHKNSFGHCLLVGGSRGRLGAISMASGACLRMGTGLVSAATWSDCWESLMISIDKEIMTQELVTDPDKLLDQRQNFQEFSTVVIGPGLGTSERAAKILRDLIQYYHPPLLIDADGINLLADPSLREELMARKGPTILTPHVGEMARMLGVDKEDVVANPLAYTENAVEQTNAIVLLKGATTFIGAGEHKIYLNDYPNDGMATAGSGDVLSGMIGGLLGQGMHVTEAVCLGVYLHSLSGDFAAQKQGYRAMTATSIVDHIGDAFVSLRKYRGEVLGLASRN